MNAAELQAFCSDRDDIRYYLQKPWSDGVYTYASNGHIIVRVARLPDVPEEPKAPNAATIEEVMNDSFNQFSGVRFARTQPREWKDIPFDSELKPWRITLKAIVIVLLWSALFGVSMWSISQSMPQQTSRSAR